GSAQAHQEWQDASQEFRVRKDAHIAKYGDDLDFPAYNFVAVDQGLDHIDHNEAMAWLARALLAVLAVFLVLGCFGLIRPARRWQAAPTAFVRALASPAHNQGLGRTAQIAVLAASAVWIGLALVTF